MSKLQHIVETVHTYLPDSITAAVILAAGDSKRMGTVNKLFYRINGIPVLGHTLIAYQNSYNKIKNFSNLYLEP